MSIKIQSFTHASQETTEQNISLFITSLQRFQNTHESFVTQKEWSNSCDQSKNWKGDFSADTWLPSPRAPRRCRPPSLLKHVMFILLASGGEALRIRINLILI